MAANRSARAAPAGEWIGTLSDVGRVRCTSFRDHRGQVPCSASSRCGRSRPVSSDLSREIQSLAGESEGPHSGLGAARERQEHADFAFVDLINRTRRDYVITIESEINIVHERQGAFSASAKSAAAATSAGGRPGGPREEPDVLVLEDLRTPALMSLALDAAAAGQLVIGGVPAHHASGAIDRLIELYQPEQRRAGAVVARAESARRDHAGACCASPAADAWRPAKCF